MNIAAHPRYESYQDTGVEWLGTVPSAWAITRLGTVFTERRTKVSDKDYEPLSVTKNGILQQLDSAAKTNDGDNRKLVKKGDFVINSRSDRKGSSGVSPLDGSVSLINIVLQPKGVHPVFCNYVLKSYAFVEEYYRMGHGIVADLWTTRYDEMRGILMALPSPDEQRAIAAFLDDKCAKIDGAVKIKEDQIALLRERRQIIIQDAVTRGLNPAAPMKDSCIDGIGQIPAHWEVKPCRYAFRSVRRSDRNGSEIKLSVTQKRGIVPTDEMEENSNQAKDFDGFQICHPDDLVLNKYKAHLGVFWRTPMRGIITNNYTVFRPLRGIVSKYFEVLFHTDPYIAIFRNTVYGVTEGMAPLYTGDFYRLPAICPPEEEQLGILGYIAELGVKFENAISIKEAQIAALKEYKTSLINAAVTGKIKVI